MTQNSDHPVLICSIFMQVLFIMILYICIATCALCLKRSLVQCKGTRSINIIFNFCIKINVELVAFMSCCLLSVPCVTQEVNINVHLLS